MLPRRGVLYNGAVADVFAGTAAWPICTQGTLYVACAIVPIEYNDIQHRCRGVTSTGGPENPLLGLATMRRHHCASGPGEVLSEISISTCMLGHGVGSVL